MTKLRAIYIIAVIAQLAWMLLAAASPAEDVGVIGWMPIGYRPPSIAIACGVVAFLLAAASPWYPLCGAASVTAIAFGIVRYSPLKEWVWASGFQTCLVVTAVAGMLLNPQMRQRLVIAWNNHRAWPKLLVALLAWMIVTELVATFGSDLVPGLKHHAIRLFESALALTFCVLVIQDRRSVAVLVTVAAASLLLTLLQRATLDGDADLAFAAAPLACLVCGITLQASFPVMLGGVLLAACLVTLSLLTANRGGNVGLFVGATVLLTSSVRSIRTLLVVTGLAVFMCVAVWASPLRPRLEEWLHSGWQTVTLATRIERWQASISLAPRRLVFGIGPGRGGQQMSELMDLGKWKATDSSPLEMLSEQGVVGLLIWVGLIVLAFAACVRGSRSSQPWQRELALGAGCCLLAMLVAGLAISRHDDIRLFWALGLAFASGESRRTLRGRTFGRGASDDFAGDEDLLAARR